MKYFFNLFFIAVIMSATLYAQKDTVDVPDVYGSGGQEGTLNDAVQTAIDGGTLSNTVFKLVPYGLYILSGTITTPPGETLEIVAPAPGNTQETSPPMIAWTPSEAPDKRYNFDIAGELIMKNLWILYASTSGTRSGSSIRVGDSSTVTGGRCDFENVIFDYSPISQNGSGAVEIYASNFQGKFTNCYFKNCTDPHFRYYSRALSFRYSSTNLHADSVAFENCTFANIGYVYMQEGAEYADNVHFNHCTFYNTVMYTLESGWWYKMSVTNSLFVNTFMFGAIPVNDGEGFGGTVAITAVDSFGFTVPFTEQDRRILFANNSYSLDQWLVDWMGYGTNGSPYSKTKHQQREDDLIPVPMPMINGATRAFFDSTDTEGNKIYPYMNSANLYDRTEDPGLINPPLNLDSLKSFLNRKWDDNSDKDWAWKPENSLNQLWPLEENIAYTNETLLTAAMGGFPLGDLYRWFPTEYANWKAQEEEEDSRILTWLETGIDGPSGVKQLKGNSVPSKFELSQNYPNPFNPVTTIGYSIPNSGNISLEVYNSIGEKVAQLVNSYQKAGFYSATFDGSKLSSGIYFYELKADNFRMTKKLILMK